MKKVKKSGKITTKFILSTVQLLKVRVWKPFLSKPPQIWKDVIVLSF